MRRVAVTLAIVLATSSATAQTTGYKVAHKPRMGLVYAGAGLLAGGFIGSVITAISFGFKGMSPSVLVPVAGPFIGFGWDMANPKSCPLDVSTVDCNSLFVDPALFVLGLTETVGATLLGIGIIPRDAKTKVTVSFTGSRFTLGLTF